MSNSLLVKKSNVDDKIDVCWKQLLFSETIDGWWTHPMFVKTIDFWWFPDDDGTDSRRKAYLWGISMKKIYNDKQSC